MALEPQNPPPPSPLVTAAPWLIALVIVLFVASLWGYFWGIGPDRYGTIEATRPVLVFTLIMAMLGFGGLLIFRSLFASQDLKERFAHAREIFLVFSGIFGTIIGFYFGAADEEDALAPISVSVSAAEQSITAEVEGGTEPFLAFLTLEGTTEGRLMSVDGRLLTITVPNANCPADASVTVVDGRGRRAEAKLELEREALRGAGWDCPEPAGEADNAQEPDNAADNAANGAG